MHELGLAVEILDALEARAEERRIRAVVVEVGVLTAVLPEALRFAFDAAKVGSLAESATLEIVEVPGRARCRACARELELSRPYGTCECGGVDFEWLSGERLSIVEMEVE